MAKYGCRGKRHPGDGERGAGVGPPRLGGAVHALLLVFDQPAALPCPSSLKYERRAGKGRRTATLLQLAFAEVLAGKVKPVGGQGVLPELPPLAGANARGVLLDAPDGAGLGDVRQDDALQPLVEVRLDAGREPPVLQRPPQVQGCHAHEADLARRPDGRGRPAGRGRELDQEVAGLALQHPLHSRRVLEPGRARQRVEPQVLRVRPVPAASLSVTLASVGQVARLAQHVRAGFVRPAVEHAHARPAVAVHHRSVLLVVVARVAAVGQRGAPSNELGTSAAIDKRLAAREALALLVARLRGVGRWAKLRVLPRRQDVQGPLPVMRRPRRQVEVSGQGRVSAGKKPGDADGADLVVDDAPGRAPVERRAEVPLPHERQRERPSLPVGEAHACLG